MRVFKSAFLTVSVLVIGALPMQAMASAKEEAALRAIFTEMLDMYTDSYIPEGSALVQEGEMLIEDSGSYYSVTLPHLKYRGEKGYTDIGMIAINAVPEGNGKWKMTVALPTPIVAYDETGNAVVSTSFGGQNFTGLYDEAIKYFTASKAVYRDIKISDPKKAVELNIAEAALTHQMTEDKKDRWSGPMNMVLSGLSFAGPKGETGKIEKIALTSSTTGYSFKEAQAYYDTLDAIDENYPEGEDMSSEHVIGIYNMITDFIGGALDGFDVGMAVTGVQFGDPSQAGEGLSSLTLGGAHFGFGMNGFRSGSVTMDYKMGYNDIAMTPPQKGFDESTPQYLNLDISLMNLPYEELTNLLKTSIEGSMQAPELGKVMGMQALLTLPQILTQAQTNLTIRHADIGNDLYDLTTTGKVVTDMAAQMGATGKARVTMRGLDALIAKLNQTAQDSSLDEMKSKKLQDLLAGLAILQMAGQIEKNDKGEEIRVYNFEATKEGKVLLNGADMSVFMGGK
ncbi:MAG TPA: hypothetical protein EYQ41_06075 [Micavibrio sp.]|nr:hypothetical protein [Micavibrio sp.]